MKRSLSVLIALGLAGPVLAQTATSGSEAAQETAAAPIVDEKPAAPAAPMAVPFTIRRLDFGLEQVDSDTNSSRFREYQALPSGVFLPYVHFGGNQKFFYDVTASNLLQRDARYSVRLDPGNVVIKADFQKMPHGFGNDAHSLMGDVGSGILAMSDTLQQGFQAAIEKQFATSKPGVNFAFLNALVSPSLAAAQGFDLSLLRERGQAEVRLTHDKPLDLRFSFFQEKRRGNRAAGTAFGFSNVVETAEPIDYRTRDFGVTGEWSRSWGLVRGGFHYNDFANRIQTQTFDNPFRATDATDASAYSAPGSGSIGGAARGRVSLPPDNKSVTGSLGFLVKFAGHSRFSADAALGQWSQDSAFMPMTTNTVISLPDQGLPGSLDGKIKTFSFSTGLTSHPADHLNLSARFRRYDLSNDTPRIAFHEGYVRFDAVFEDIPRITVPYGYTTDNLALSAAYNIGSVNLEAGYKLDRWDRTFRETESTTQNVGYLKADVHASDWLVLRGSAEKGSRGFSGLEIERSEHASYSSAGLPVNLLAIPAESTNPALQRVYASFGCPSEAPCNLRFDQADRDISRYGAYAELSPGGKATITFSYLKGKDDYKENAFGLITSDSESITAEADYTPSDRANVYGFYTRENLSTFQRGRQSGATVSFNPLDNWTSEIADKVDSFGGGATFGVVKEKLDLKLYGNYQKVDGNNDLVSPAGGVPQNARAAVGGVIGIPFFDDTRIYTFSADLAYKATGQLTLGLGGWYQKYTLQDANSNAATEGIVLANYVPGSFFLAANDHDYEGHVIYVRASYAW